jgi:hypothetical protein
MATLRSTVHSALTGHTGHNDNRAAAAPAQAAFIQRASASSVRSTALRAVRAAHGRSRHGTTALNSGRPTRTGFELRRRVPPSLRGGAGELQSF